MQTVIVTIVALVALAVVARRVFGAILPKKSQAACPSCQAGDHCEPATETPASEGQPLVLVRTKTH
jgi:hypothetical protein